jgi:hypothetical protein
VRTVRDPRMGPRTVSILSVQIAQLISPCTKSPCDVAVDVVDRPPKYSRHVPDLFAFTVVLTLPFVVDVTVLTVTYFEVPLALNWTWALFEKPMYFRCQDRAERSPDRVTSPCRSHRAT